MYEYNIYFYFFVYCISIGSWSSNIYRFLPTHRSSAALLPLCGIPVSMIEPFVGGRELRRLTDKCAQETQKHTDYSGGFFWGVWTVTGKLGPAMDGAIRCLDDGQTVFRRTGAIPRFWSLDRFTVAATRFHRVFSSFHGFHQSRDDGISVC